MVSPRPKSVGRNDEPPSVGSLLAKTPPSGGYTKAPVEHHIYIQPPAIVGDATPDAWVFEVEKFADQFEEAPAAQDATTIGLHDGGEAAPSSVDAPDAASVSDVVKIADQFAHTSEELVASPVGGLVVKDCDAARA